MIWSILAAIVGMIIGTIGAFQSYHGRRNIGILFIAIGLGLLIPFLFQFVIPYAEQLLK